MVEYIYIAIVDIKFKVKELKYFNFYSGIAIYKLLLPGTVYIFFYGEEEEWKKITNFNLDQNIYWQKKYYLV